PPGLVDESARPARDCGNSMVRLRTSSNRRTKSMLSAPGLLLRARFRRHQPGDAVIHDELPVVLSRVLKEAPRHIGNPCLLIREWVDDEIVHPRITLQFDCRRAVGKRSLHKRDHGGLRFVLVALALVSGRRLQSHHRVRKKIIRIRGVQQLLRKAPLRRHGPEVVLVLGKIFRHRNQLPSDIIPVVQQSLRRPDRRLRRRIFFHRVFGRREHCKDPYHKNYTNDFLLHFEIPPKSQFPVETRLAASSETGQAPSLLQSSLAQHLQKLLQRAHIDRLRHQLSFAVVDKTFWYPLHHKHFVYLPPGIE